MMEALIAWNKQCIEKINAIQSDSLDGGDLSAEMRAGDDLLSFPPIMEKAKGHERTLLQIFCQRYRALVEANQLFDDEHKPFGAAFNALKMNMRALAKEIDPARDWEINDESELIARVEALVK